MKVLSGKLEIEPILELIRGAESRAEIEGFSVKVSGVRLETFATKGADCICCPRKGEFFRIEDNSSGPHLNLYTYNSLGEEVLMTRDHIVPRSQGGKECLSNMSPMCSRCNKLRDVKDQAEFLKDFKDGRYNPGGDLHAERLAASESCRKAALGRKKIAAPAGVKNAVDAHVEKYGLESHLGLALRGLGINKLHKRKALLKICKDLKDDDGCIIINEMNRNDTHRRKVVAYFKATHMSSGTMSGWHLAQLEALNNTDNPNAHLGILMTAVRRHLDAPQKESETLLRVMLEELKRTRN